jgi:membrane protease YdiL (CAAX protease family)
MKMNRNQSQLNYKIIITFIITAYTFSWLIWMPNLISHNFNLSWNYSNLLHLTGGLGPMFAAIITTMIYSKKKGVKKYFKNKFLKFSGLKWIYIAIFIPIGFFLISFLLIRVISGEWTDSVLIGVNSKIPFENQLLIWLSWIFFYGIGEESGWRGFLFPELMKKFNLRTAALYTAFIWAGWHLPIFFYDNNFQEMGLIGVFGWLIGLIVGSYILGWLTVNADWNLWPAILWHATFNFFTAGDKISPLYPALITMMVIILGLWLSRKY